MYRVIKSAVGCLGLSGRDSVTEEGAHQHSGTDAKQDGSDWAVFPFICERKVGMIHWKFFPLGGLEPWKMVFSKFTV